LVDAYVADQLQGDTLKRFETQYLASDRRRQRGEFAEALRSFQRTPAPARAAGTTFKRRWFRLPRPALQWGLAAAGLAMLFVSSYLLLEMNGLRREVEQARAQNDAAGESRQQLEKELADQRAANRAALKELEQVREAGPDLGQLRTVSVLLPPPTRSLVQVKNLSIHAATDLAVLLLALEADDFFQYQATLKDGAGGRVIWRSRELEATAANERKAVTVAVFAGIFKAQTYIAELFGVRKGKTEIVGSYPF